MRITVPLTLIWALSACATDAAIKVPNLTTVEHEVDAAHGPACRRGVAWACQRIETFKRWAAMKRELPRCGSQPAGCARARTLVEHVCGARDDCPEYHLLRNEEARAAINRRRHRLEAARAQQIEAHGWNSLVADQRRQREKDFAIHGVRRELYAIMLDRPLEPITEPPPPGTLVLYADEKGVVRPARIVTTSVHAARVKVGEEQREIEVLPSRLRVYDWTRGTPLRCIQPPSWRSKRATVKFVAGEDLELSYQNAACWACTDRRTVK